VHVCSYGTVCYTHVIPWLGMNNDCPSLTPTPKLLTGCGDKETVDDESVIFDCIFGASFTRFLLLTAHYWIIKSPDGHTVTVDSTSGINDGYIMLLRSNCPSQIDEPCCRVKSSLIINNAALSLNDATVSCYAGLKFPNSEKSSSSASLSNVNCSLWDHGRFVKRVFHTYPIYQLSNTDCKRTW